MHISGKKELKSNASNAQGVIASYNFFLTQKLYVQIQWVRSGPEADIKEGQSIRHSIHHKPDYPSILY
jgi:hypothetical protein